jgi:pyrophosphatase PpaX
MYKGVLFDNDGTLVDTYDLILASMRHGTKTVLGHTFPDDVLMRKVGQPLAVQMCDFTDDPDLQSEILRVYREYNHAVHDQVVKAFPGVKEGLAELRRHGYALGVVTSKMHALAWRGLEITGLAPYLDCCIGADDCVRYKPEAEPVERGAAALGLEPANCLYVGDAPYDIQSGNAAGAGTVAALWGMFSADELRADSPDYECATFADLVAFLTEAGSRA